MEKFKSIFFVEYAHRALGNGVGFLFMLPLGYFAWRGVLLKGLKIRLFGLLALGGFQGLIGWWMVKSGLKQKPDYHVEPKVSVYRLFVHLNMAVVLFSILFWNSLTLLQKPAEAKWTTTNFNSMTRARKGAFLLVHLLAFNIASGAIVAGLDAGRVFNTWPLMNGAFVPSGYWKKEKGTNNLFENMANVQFNHRLFAYVTYTAATGK